jgi:putative radical SAM enzyme (TIGR03279 family)
MTLFREIDWTTRVGGQIANIMPDSLADEIGLQVGDELLAINDNEVQDVIDVQFYAAEEYLELLIRRGEEYLLYEAEREYGQELGIEFAHPTFDIDIRRCNNLCEFCFVLQMAPRFRRTLYIKDDDYRYSFLFGHFVTLTNLDEHDWWRIENMHLSPLYVSVHVTDWELRKKFLRNDNAPDIMEQLRWLAERGIQMHTQLVVVPGFNDDVWLKRSIAELESLWPAVQSISVVPVGLTKQHKYQMRPHTSQEAATTLAYVEALQPQYQARLGVRFVYPTDEWYLVSGREVPPLDAYDGQDLYENGLGMVRRFLNDWAEVKEEIAAAIQKPGFAPPTRFTADKPLTLVTATLFAPTLQKTSQEFAQLVGISVHVMPAINQRLGETITVSGLLMAEDVIAQLEKTGYSDLVILPRIMFDHPDKISLDDMTPMQVAKRLNCTIALADTMGDVWDALIGQSKVIFDPGADFTLSVIQP